MIPGTSALKRRAIEAVLQTKGASTAGTLRALQNGGVITPEQFGAWNNVRHKVMHGNLLSPYSNENQDKQLEHLIAIVHGLTRDLVKRE
jgi:hypothetical protein